MSDIGLFPPGAFAWFCSLALLIGAGGACVVTVLILWIRNRRALGGWRRDRLSGHALGAFTTASAAGFSALLIDWSGSLGRFSRWIDHTATATIWLLFLIALWPVAAYFWNHAAKGRAPAPSAPDR